MPIIFLFNFFGGLARGPPGARGPRFIEPPEPPIATPLEVIKHCVKQNPKVELRFLICPQNSLNLESVFF